MRLFKNRYLVKVTYILFILFLMFAISSMPVSKFQNQVQADESVTFTEFLTPTAGVGPTSITTGPDGNLWFTEYEGDNIGRITPNGTITEFPIPTAGSQPFGITTGPDGNLWFTE